MVEQESQDVDPMTRENKSTKGLKNLKDSSQMTNMWESQKVQKI